MGTLAEHADHVIGVDTHRDAHSAAAITTTTGIVAAQTTVAAEAFGCERLLRSRDGMHATGAAGRSSPPAASAPA